MLASSRMPRTAVRARHHTRFVLLAASSTSHAAQERCSMQWKPGKPSSTNWTSAIPFVQSSVPSVVKGALNETLPMLCTSFCPVSEQSVLSTSLSPGRIPHTLRSKTISMSDSQRAAESNRQPALRAGERLGVTSCLSTADHRRPHAVYRADTAALPTRVPSRSCLWSRPSTIVFAFSYLPSTAIRHRGHGIVLEFGHPTSRTGVRHPANPRMLTTALTVPYLAVRGIVRSLLLIPFELNHTRA